MATFIYELKSGCLSCDGEYVNIGDVFDFKLKPQPNFPATIRGTVEDIIDVKPGVYEFSYDETLVGGFQLAHCNFDGLPKCLSCCDLLEERIEELEDPDNFKERVIEALDNDGDGDFDADDIDGLTDFITNNVSNGNIIIDASNITNLPAEVASIITTDPATQTAIIDVVQGGIDNGSIVIDANDVQGFCSKVSECIATGASDNEAIATALAPLLESRIQIEDLQSTSTDTNAFYVPDGNGGVTTEKKVQDIGTQSNVTSAESAMQTDGIYTWKKGDCQRISIKTGTEFFHLPKVIDKTLTIRYPEDFSGSLGELQDCIDHMLVTQSGFVNVSIADGTYTMSQPLRDHRDGARISYYARNGLPNPPTEADFTNNRSADEANLRSKYKVVIENNSSIGALANDGYLAVTNILFVSTNGSFNGIQSSKTGHIECAGCSVIGFSRGIVASIGGSVAFGAKTTSSHNSIGYFATIGGSMTDNGNAGYEAYSNNVSGIVSSAGGVINSNGTCVSKYNNLGVATFHVATFAFTGTVKCENNVSHGLLVHHAGNASLGDYTARNNGGDSINLSQGSTLYIQQNKTINVDSAIRAGFRSTLTIGVGTVVTGATYSPALRVVGNEQSYITQEV